MSSHGGERDTTFGGGFDSPFASYALSLLSDFCGIRFRYQPRDARVGLCRSNDAARECEMRMPAVDGYSRGTVPRPPTEVEFRAAHDPAAPFPFDLISALRYWLADEGNTAEAGARHDEHDRLIAASSAQEAAGVRESAIVNEYLLLARHWLRVRTRAAVTSHLPTGRRCVVVLSHDVDSPFHPFQLASEIGMAAGSIRQRRARAATWRVATAVARAAALSVVRPPGRHWLFDRIVAEEEKLGLTSTFFFAATSRFEPGGTRFDVRYDLASRRIVRQLRRLRDRGVEIGLHVGYGAAPDAAAIEAERGRLEDAAGTSVNVSRHHYWHLGTDIWGSLAAHEQAGLDCDSSLAFEEAPGYRLGVALPMRLWSPKHRRALESLQVPTLAMDSAVLGPDKPRRGIRSVRDVETRRRDRCVTRVTALIEELKRFGGVAALDWHEYTAHPASVFRAWGEAYLGILQEIATDPEVQVMTYRDLVEARRRAGHERVLAPLTERAPH